MTKQTDELMKEWSNPHGNTSPSTKGGNGMDTSSPSSYNTMPQGCMFCSNCETYDHDTSHCVYACEVQPPSHEHDSNMENVNAMNFAPRMGNVGNLRPNSNQMGNWN